jgi:hypothetical protein
MSRRTWEGIRHDEYKFTDLPKNVREKEEDFVYTKLSDHSRVYTALDQIPESDRTDFIHAYEAGDRKEAGKVLSRDSFRRNVSLEKSAGATHQAATVGKTFDDKQISADKTTEPAATPPESSAMIKIKENVAALKNVALLDADSDPSVAALPNAATPVASGRSPA